MLKTFGELAAQSGSVYSTGMVLNVESSTDATPAKVPQGWALIIDDHPLFCDALELTLRALGVAHLGWRTCARVDPA